jgi:hypothetical protein
MLGGSVGLGTCPCITDARIETSPARSMRASMWPWWCSTVIRMDCRVHAVEIYGTQGLASGVRELQLRTFPRAAGYERGEVGGG